MERSGCEPLPSVRPNQWNGSASPTLSISLAMAQTEKANSPHRAASSGTRMPVGQRQYISAIGSNQTGQDAACGLSRRCSHSC